MIFLFLFLPVVLFVHFVVFRERGRNTFLVVASLFFYAWGETWFVFIMLASVAANYLLGLWIDTARSKTAAKVAVAGAVVTNLGILCTFKYAGFFLQNLNALLSILHFPPILMDPIHLPIGISFFSFQAMSYVIDVYRKEAHSQRNPLNVALYISLFPQLVAGPIVRYRDISDQIIRRTISREDLAIGMKRFIVGLSKKVMIADVIGRVVDQIFLLPGDQLTWTASWVGGIAFTIQLYFDFSGYSDMAIGLGRMFGFHFLENFNYPYIARSMREFWKRWHISLTTWFRDYLFIPMGGSRGSKARTHFNLLTVFFLCGLWHGASWNYVIWGFSHGVFLVIERTRFGKWIESTWAPIGHAYFLFVFIVTLSFFRTDSLFHASVYLPAMFGFTAATGKQAHVMQYLNSEILMVALAGIIFSTPIAPYLSRLRKGGVASLSEKSYLLVEGIFSFAEVAGYIFLLVLAAAWLAGNTYQPFIYFRF
jgi:alginate O-acetyltransferase complex protein AlgI